MIAGLVLEIDHHAGEVLAVSIEEMLGGLGA
jgi:hypothetical protein